MQVLVSFKRLVVVSHRGPLVIKKNKTGQFFSRSVSGLVSAVKPIIESVGGTWIAWCGRKSVIPREGETWQLPLDNPRFTLKEIMITPRECLNFYHGFSNKCLWPLCHSFVDRSVINPRFWKHYVQVNTRFAQATAAEWKKNDMIWVHDYHLALVPQMLRLLRPQARVAFFWHIPFPPLEIISILPWARELLEGLLGSDSIAFHSSRYVENFFKSVYHILGARIAADRGKIFWRGRTTSVRSFPVGIETGRFEQIARSPKVQEKVAAIRRQVGDRFLALGVDRLDYTKGIVERLKGIELFLMQNPHYRRRFAFLQVAVPSRSESKDYRKLRWQVEEMVNRINGRFGDLQHLPLRCYFGSFNLEKLIAHYRAADLALVTPLRDGLNLVAKEFVASKVDNSGVLILSPFAGVAEQLNGAVLVNPYHTQDLADKIRLALEMPEEEKKTRMQKLRETVRTGDCTLWWHNTLKSLVEAEEKQAAGHYSSCLDTVEQIEKKNLAKSP